MTTLAPANAELTRMAQTFGGVAGIWLEPAHPLHCEAVDAMITSTGLSRAQLEESLQAAFSEATEGQILKYWNSEPAFHQAAGTAGQKALHILPSTVFTSWIPGAITAMLSGFDCWLKPSALEPVFAPLWKRSVAEIDPLLANRITIVSWDAELLKTADAIVAYGSDETLAILRRQTPAEKRFIGYGHKISVAIVFREALDDKSEVLSSLQRDVQPFNLQGCLSPQTVYVERGDPVALSAHYPGGRPHPRFRRFEAWEEVQGELAVLQPHLSTLGYAGPDSRIRDLLPVLEPLQFSRICRLGEMQQPPLTWRNGGISLAAALRS